VLSARGIDDYADVLAHHVTVRPRGTVIEDDNGDRMILQGIAVADLDPDFFLL
jgi:hypothetical protein